MSLRVVLVDDVVDVRRLVRLALRVRGGFEVVGEASDGTEAVDLAASLRPDIVVLDLGLPDLAGREVLTGIQSNSPASKVVVFSGSESPDEVWVQERVQAYVTKGEEIEYLVDLLESVARPSDTEASLELPQALLSASKARRFVADTVKSWKLDQILDDALLVASELATNAVTHADSSCRIRLSLNSASLRIDVLDKGIGTPEPQAAEWSEEHGRGLHLVAALTMAWGLEVVPGDGKLVWAELARPA